MAGHEPVAGQTAACDLAHNVRSPAPGASAPARISASAEHIHEKLQSAILEHRLPPGTKLGEDRLAEMFATSRARVRQVLVRLAHQQLVDVLPQRGAFVASPTPQQARDVFEARRLLEPAVLSRLMGNCTPAKLKRLRQHLAKEVQARQQNDARAVIRLSGEFHCLLAELAGNSAFVRVMRELCAQTCLVISLYNTSMAHSCRADEHACLVDAMERQDLAQALALALEHLAHIESSLVLDPGEGVVDLESILLG